MGVMAVTLRGAGCVLGGFPALVDVDLDVHDGEAVLVSGGNGAGKSTLLRLIAGLAPLTKGSGCVLGRPLTPGASLPGVVYVGHRLGFYEDLDVATNLGFWTRVAGVPVSMSEVLSRFGVDQFARFRVGLLSAGQRQRVALALAFASRPRLLLLDEPHAGLDRVARDELTDALAGHAASGGSALIVSHEHDVARVTTQRELVLMDGHSFTNRS